MESFFKPKRTGTIFMFADIDGAKQETGYYNDFVDEKALFETLIKLKQSKTELWNDYYYRDYLGITTRSEFTYKYGVESTRQGAEPKQGMDIPYTVNANGVKKQLVFDVRLNKKLGTIETGLSGGIKVNLNESFSKYKIHANYSDDVKTNSADEKITIATLDLDKGTYSDRKNKVIAIEISTRDYESYRLLMSDLFPDLNLEEYVVRAYLNSYKTISKNDAEKLNNFYSQVPTIAMLSISDELKFNDFRTLLVYDANNGVFGWFTDSSRAMLNILAGFKDLSSLYEMLKNDPQFVKSVYSHLGSDKDTEEFCDFLMVLGWLFDPVDKIEDLPKVYHGGRYSLDSDLFFGKKDVVRIVNLEKYTEFVPYEEKAGKDFLQFQHNTTQTHSNVLSDEYYNPLQQIRLIDANTHEELIVPAIYVKRLSDIAEWETIMKVFYTALNILSIFISVGIIFKGAVGLIRFIAVTDILISSTDIALSNDEIKKELRASGPAGEWFADNWGAISLVSSFGLLSIPLAKRIIEKAPKILNKLANQQLRQQIIDLYIVAKKAIGQVDELIEIFNKRYLKLYVRPDSLFPVLSRWKISNTYGKFSTRLYDAVEKEIKELRKILKNGNKKLERVLVSGMVDKETGTVSKLFTNFTKKEIDNGLHKLFLENLHPNLVKRLDEHMIRRAAGLNLQNADDIKFGWKNLGMGEIIPHAEFRALDDILKTISKSELPESVFERILGYNRHLKKDGIMHPCADCFYLTDLVTFIK